jgi:hypothetical protein
MNDVDPQLFDQTADDPSLRLLSGDPVVASARRRGR